MTYDDILNKVKDGKIFRVTFTKKDGTERVMVCRFGVKKYTKGVGLKFNPKNRNLLSVWDVQKEAYRFVNVDTIRDIRHHGEEEEVTADRG